MIYPEFLKKGDAVAVTALSAGSECEMDKIRLNLAKERFGKMGFNVIETPNCYTSICGRSSSAETRGKEFNSVIENNDAKAIILLAGGEFLVESLSNIDFDLIKKFPKWIQGYSDPTGILYSVTTNLDIATLYGENFRSFAMDPMHKSLENDLSILSGEGIIQESFDLYEDEWREYVTGKEEFELTKPVKWINLNEEKVIDLSGRIIGGCLDILLFIIGTKYDGTLKFIEKYKNDGIIWYFDNCELSSEDIIRAMWKMKELGFFKYTKGIIWGRTGIEKSCKDISFQEAIKQSLSDLNVPIILEADIGHKPPRMTIINGAITHINSSNGKGSISFELR